LYYSLCGLYTILPQLSSSIPEQLEHPSVKVQRLLSLFFISDYSLYIFHFSASKTITTHNLGMKLAARKMILGICVLLPLQLSPHSSSTFHSGRSSVSVIRFFRSFLVLAPSEEDKEEEEAQLPPPPLLASSTPPPPPPSTSEEGEDD
jgi:hypothetical protein